MLSAVREGDPLAYGPDRLRQARSTFDRQPCQLEPDHGSERSRLVRTDRESSQVNQTGAAVAAASERSAIVAELDEVIEHWAPDLLRPSSLAASGQTRPHERDGLSRLAPPPVPDLNVGLRR